MTAKKNLRLIPHRIINIKKSCTNNIHIVEKVFCSFYICRFVSHFFSDKLRKLVLCFDLYESSLHSYERKDQIDTDYEKLT